MVIRQTRQPALMESFLCLWDCLNKWFGSYVLYMPGWNWLDLSAAIWKEVFFLTLIQWTPEHLNEYVEKPPLRRVLCEHEDPSTEEEKQTWVSEAEGDRGREEGNALQLDFLPAFVEDWWGVTIQYRWMGYLCARPGRIGSNCLPVQAHSKAQLDSVAPQ